MSAHPERHDDEPRAVQQRSPYLPYGRIERARVKQGPHSRFIEAVVLSGGIKESYNIAMRDQYPFRFAGRARGIDDIGRIIRFGRRAEIPMVVIGRPLERFDNDGLFD